jgi:hypothetical protein
MTVATERDRAMPAPVKIPKFLLSLSQEHQESEPVRIGNAPWGGVARVYGRAAVGGHHDHASEHVGPAAKVL